MRCFILLLLVGSAYAQPVTGPFDVWQEDSAYVIGSLSTVEHNDTLELLWSAFDFAQERSIVHRAALSMSDQEIAIPCTTLGLRSDWYWTVYRPRMTGAGVWRAGLSGGDIQYYPNYHWSSDYHFFLGDIGSELLTVRGSNLGLRRFHDSNWPYIGCYGQEFLSDIYVLNTISGRVLLASIVNICYNIFEHASEPQYWTRIYEFDPNLDTLSGQTTLYDSPAPLYGPTDLSATSYSDNAIAVLSGGETGGQAFGLSSFVSDSVVASSHLICELSDFEHFEIGQTVGGQLLVLSDWILFSADTTGDCRTLSVIPEWNANIDPFFHPNYGFATLQVNPGYLFLARIDTSGNEVQPVGVLYETDGTSFIVDADVTISDSGEVIAVWSEYTDWNEGPHVLKIAWTDWTTYLGTPVQQAPAIPSEISLSSYPNPFNSTVTIKYDLPTASRVSLSIFDIRGRLVETLLDDFTPSGSHTQSWSPTELASGVYFARLNADQVSATSKLLYLK
ncbi:MAG: T9SS type A sorting domain-containing protein [bacterium]|nr:T9SS type A sorting domain-containing protein [bacterium]